MAVSSSGRLEQWPSPAAKWPSPAARASASAHMSKRSAGKPAGSGARKAAKHDCAPQIVIAQLKRTSLPPSHALRDATSYWRSLSNKPEASAADLSAAFQAAEVHAALDRELRKLQDD